MSGRIAEYEPQTRQNGLLMPPKDQTNRLSAEDLSMIRERIALDGTYVDENALWGFNAIASTDAVDSYYTRPDVERALKPYADDLKTGTSVLGNHDYRTFPYGSSFDGSVIDVPANDYFVNDAQFKASKGTLGRYYIVKDVEVNGNKTNDLIRLAQYGAAKRTSITFFPDHYDCSICARDMMSYDCEHIPGVRYGDNKSLAYGWIMDSRLLETSLVFRNASPDSMLQRKVAEAMVQGDIPQRFIAGLAQRFEIAEPNSRRLPIVARKGAKDMAERHEAAPEAQPELVVTEADPKPPITPEPEPTPEPKPAEALVEPVAKVEADADVEPTPVPAEVAAEKPEEKQEEDEKPKEDKPIEVTPAQVEAAVQNIVQNATKDDIGRYASLVEDRCATLGVKTPSASAASDFQTKAAEILGVPRLTLDTAREIAGRASIGDKLFKDLVDRTIKARVSSGSTFDEAKYREVLTKGADVGFVESELKSHEEARARRWSSGRLVAPEPSIPYQEPDEDKPGTATNSNVFEHLTGHAKSPRPFEIKRN